MRRKVIVIAAVLVLGLFLAAAVLAATTAGFSIDWWTAEGGGQAAGARPSGSFELSGTLGQPDTGQMSGGAYELAGGFWSGGTAAGQALYLPVILGGTP